MSKEYLNVLALLFTAIFSKNTYSQLALPSLFPDVTSANPAVIGIKEVEVLRFKFKTRTITREQEIQKINNKSIEASQDDHLNLWKYNLMGGVNKDSYKSEWMLDYTLGRQSTDLKSDNQVIDYNINTWAYIARYAFGTNSGWGAQLRYVRHNSNFSYESNNTDEALSDNIDLNSSMPGLKLGKRFGTKDSSFGLTVELNELKSHVNSREQSKNKSTLIPILGAAVGIKGRYGHFEVGLDVDPFSDRKKGPLEEKAPGTPTKLTLVAEKRIYQFILGYIGLVYNGRYIDPEAIILTQLVHRNNINGTRIQHIFKFSYEDFPKGFSLGASIYLSYLHSKERSSVYLGNEKHDTEAIGRGAGISMSYTF